MSVGTVLCPRERIYIYTCMRVHGASATSPEPLVPELQSFLVLWRKATAMSWEAGDCARVLGNAQEAVAITSALQTHTRCRPYHT